MNRRKILLSVCVFLSAMLMGGAADRSVALLECAYYEKTSFDKTIAEAKPYETDGTLQAGVVPHHLLAGRMIASFFATVAQQNTKESPIETVVFVAPSHYPNGDPIITALSGWRTPFGILENDIAFTQSILQNGMVAARADEKNMEFDHAVTGLMPYVKYYLPDVKIAAFLLDNRGSAEHMRAFVRILHEASLKKNILVVGSVDFSHYLTPEDASVHDAQTQRALESRDYTTIARFTDANMDSPLSVMAYLRYAEACGIQQTAFLDHDSADRILALHPSDAIFRDGITTYFVLGAFAPEK